MDVSAKGLIPFQLKARLLISSYKDQPGALGIRAVGGGRNEK